MKGFVEISASEQSLVFAGKDADVSRFMEALGYGIGSIVRAIKIMIQNRKNLKDMPVEFLMMYAK
ncbi:MAG: hypothetical protein IK041_06900 [Bacteroidales bacterium]|nr:hypothetical protein [Bacteroidales bacterium]